MGGLGNQMFQISHAVCQGFKHNRTSIFNPISNTPLQGKQPPTYLGNIFKKINFSNEQLNCKIINEVGFGFNDLSPHDDNTLFIGYFQSSKNFFGFDEKIIELFSPSDDIVSLMKEKYNFNENKITVSLHIRRGDYLKFPNIHPTLSQDYVNKILSSITYDRLLVFGEDKLFLKENFSDKNSIIIDEEDWYEMWLMSLCDINIMSNSTFSWWGSFLNKKTNKKVYVPSIWFGPQGPKDFQDIYEGSWIKVDSKFKEGFIV
jgi:hypothetical protein